MAWREWDDVGSAFNHTRLLAGVAGSSAHVATNLDGPAAWWPPTDTLTWLSLQEACAPAASAAGFTGGGAAVWYGQASTKCVEEPQL